jgi:hypothetical protein
MDYFFAQLLTAYDRSSQGGGDIFSFLSADFFGSAVVVLKVYSVLMFAAIVFALYKFSKLRVHRSHTQHITEALRGSVVSTNRLAKQWGRIRERLEHISEAEWKIAVIEADNLVDDLLRRMGYSGASMGERLKSISPSQVQTLDALWAAHKVRNKIVHDPETRLLHKEARGAIGNFEMFLHEAQVLE